MAARDVTSFFAALTAFGMTCPGGKVGTVGLLERGGNGLSAQSEAPWPTHSLLFDALPALPAFAPPTALLS